MYFVAPKSFQVVIKKDVTQRRFDGSGNMQEIEEAPPIYAEFKRDTPIPSEYRLLAVEYFGNPKRMQTAVNPDHPGRAAAQPFDYLTGLGYHDDGQTADAKGHTAVYEGQTPAAMIGVLNTDDPAQVASENKTLVEEHLLNPDKGYGRRWIHFASTVPTPWASYDKLAGEGVVKKIIERIEDDGLDPAYVLKYERANKDRHAVTKALEEYIAAQGA